jgi:hypothetical protein
MTDNAIDRAIAQVRKQRSATEPLHLTALRALVLSGLLRDPIECEALGIMGIEAVRAEGYVEEYPVTAPTRKAIDGRGPIDFLGLPMDDQASLVALGFVAVVGSTLMGEDWRRSLN